MNSIVRYRKTRLENQTKLESEKTQVYAQFTIRFSITDDFCVLLIVLTFFVTCLFSS